MYHIEMQRAKVLYKVTKIKSKMKRFAPNIYEHSKNNNVRKVTTVGALAGLFPGLPVSIC